MKKISFLILMTATSAIAEVRDARIIYGVDNRVEPFEASALQRQLSKSTAGMIQSIKVVKDGAYSVLPPSTIQMDMGLCKEERFVDQPSAVICSGFLVAPDLLVTAGHCIPNQKRCEEMSWVFDYHVKKDTNRADVMVANEKIYKCAQVIEAKLENLADDKKDYALVRLDRPVTDRKPLKFRTAGKISEAQELFVIGHPSGLPTKVASEAKVFDNTAAGYFETNLDTFGGNSGSAVFNAQSGTIEGILVRGAKDYVKDGRCIRVNNAPEDIEGQPALGESVSRITDIKALGNRNRLFSFIQDSNQEEAIKLVKEISDLDMVDEDFNTALHVAIDKGESEIAVALIKAGANLDHQNFNGETPLHRAAFMNNGKVVSHLVASGADVLVKDKFGVFASGRTNYFAFGMRRQLRQTEYKEKMKRLRE